VVIIQAGSRNSEGVSSLEFIPEFISVLVCHQFVVKQLIQAA
jgi:hypothetical protein